MLVFFLLRRGVYQTYVYIHANAILNSHHIYCTRISECCEMKCSVWRELHLNRKLLFKKKKNVKYCCFEWQLTHNIKIFERCPVVRAAEHFTTLLQLGWMALQPRLNSAVAWIVCTATVELLYSMVYSIIIYFWVSLFTPPAFSSHLWTKQTWKRTKIAKSCVKET